MSGRTTGDYLEALRFIAEYLERNHLSPSRREMQDGLKLSSSSLVALRINALKARGYVTDTPGVQRSMRVTSAGYETLGMQPPTGAPVVTVAIVPHAPKAKAQTDTAWEVRAMGGDWFVIELGGAPSKMRGRVVTALVNAGFSVRKRGAGEVAA